MANRTLKQNDLKTTKGREAVLCVLKKAAVPMTAEDIYSAVLHKMRMSVSTTYRTLATLSEKGILLKSLSVDGKTHYQLNSQTHKHFLHCTECDAIVPLDDCPIHALEQQVSEKTGYIITNHSFELHGICPKCAKRETKVNK